MTRLGILLGCSQMKTIKYFTKNVYGRDLEYVIDPNDAKFIANLTGRKTLEARDRLNIEGLSSGEIKFERTINPVH